MAVKLAALMGCLKVSWLVDLMVDLKVDALAVYLEFELAF